MDSSVQEEEIEARGRIHIASSKKLSSWEDWVMFILRVSFQAQKTFPIDVEPEAMYSAQKDKLLWAFGSMRNYGDMPSKAGVEAKEATGWRRAERGNGKWKE